jgi:hypothetical protein
MRNAKRDDSPVYFIISGLFPVPHIRRFIRECDGNLDRKDTLASWNDNPKTGSAKSAPWPRDEEVNPVD